MKYERLFVILWTKCSEVSLCLVMKTSVWWHMTHFVGDPLCDQLSAPTRSGLRRIDRNIVGSRLD